VTGQPPGGRLCPILGGDAVAHRDKACNPFPSVLDLRRAFVSEQLSLLAVQRSDRTAQQELSPAAGTGVEGSVFGLAFALTDGVAMHRCAQNSLEQGERLWNVVDFWVC
jgi:hypothetical protein